MNTLPLRGAATAGEPDERVARPIAARGAAAPLNGILLDERSGRSARQVIGMLLSRATHADFAVARIRLGVVDLTAAELARVRRCRVLVGRLDVQSLAADDGYAAALRGLLAFLRSGRLEVRSAGAAGWTADFSVFRGLPPGPTLPAGLACLVGAHTFWHVDQHAGPSFTCVLGGPGAAACVTRRFEELWRSGYDVLPVLTHTIEAALADGAVRPAGAETVDRSADAGADERTGGAGTEQAGARTGMVDGGSAGARGGA